MKVYIDEPVGFWGHAQAKWVDAALGVGTAEKIQNLKKSKSRRKQELFLRLGEGEALGFAAHSMNMSVSTARTHVGRLKGDLGATCLADLIHTATSFVAVAKFLNTVSNNQTNQ